ncbi:MAG: processing protein DprA [Microbacteriaceae bacterium]|nr:processing protein DprA [Microbacteriaceae bacterium]
MSAVGGVPGLDGAEARQLVRAVSPTDGTPSQVDERVARAGWSGITEPGDRIAGALVERLGAAPALAAVFAGPSPAELGELFGTDAPTAKELEEALARWKPRLHGEPVLRSLAQAARWGARLLIPGDAAWPVGVDDLGPHAPIALWLRGNEHALASTARSVALVGARAATGYGEHVAMEAAAGLVERGFTVVSGAAYGIDGMAHRAALAGSGTTVAFLAGGVDRFYPSGHDALLARIADVGAVVSELPCGAAPTRWRFLQRNRLIAAASSAVVVVEAGLRSGSLNTAHHAASLGRPIGAVPGPVTSAASAGCHRLLREAMATCVTSAREMAELVEDEESVEISRDDMDPEAVRVLDALSTRSPRAVDDIAARAGLGVQPVMAVLGALALDGRVAENERGWVTRR